MGSKSIYQVSTCGLWWQFNTKEIPTLGCGWRRKFYAVQNSSVLIQHSCENSMAMRQPWGQATLVRATVLLDNSVLLLAGLLWPALVCSALFQWGIFSVSAQPGKSNLQWKGKVYSQSKRRAHLDRVFAPGPLIGLFSGKSGLQSFAVWLAWKAVSDWSD